MSSLDRALSYFRRAGDEPSILRITFYVYYTHLQTENGNLPRKDDSLRRLTVACP